jgi:hypothetical protein
MPTWNLLAEEKWALPRPLMPADVTSGRSLTHPHLVSQMAGHINANQKIGSPQNPLPSLLKTSPASEPGRVSWTVPLTSLLPSLT